MTDLDLVRDVPHLILRIALACLARGGVLLVNYHIARSGYVALVQSLDVQAHAVTWICKNRHAGDASHQ